ncbi:hypothetical protein E0Z10_g6005 [Xylaria hypoxylon]|uniref:Alcohol acetyltransferase n=1 Tax=Xylaria hypoxylon TaxID=37992 RepID=A0A4Z0YH61_9PEZI|nr:hypothetical protein E0Z10_g6005 [Xylaria hypoxylon]
MAVTKKDEGGKPGIIRSFGNLECYEFHMLQLRFLGNTIVTCRYTTPAALAAPELHDGVVARVEDAIARVVLEHPALRIDVVNADSKRPAWVGVNRVEFAHHVQWEDISGNNDANENTAIHSEERLREIVERRLDEPDANLAKRPGWRVLVLYKKKGGDPFLDIVFDYSHALGDGTSGKVFHETLLRLLNTSTSTETEAALTNRILTIPPTASPLPPPMEKLAKFSLSAKFAISTAWKELVFSPSSTAQAHWAPIRATPYRTRFRTFNIQDDDMRGILAACRAHKTTLTGLLHALLLVCMASRIPAQDATAFTGSTALDLRRHIAASPDLDPRHTVADYVSQLAHEFDADLVRRIRDVNGTDTMAPALVDIVWSCAARVRGEIQKRLDQGLKDDLVGLMKLVPDWRAQLRAEASKARVYSFVVSNLGVLDCGSHAENRDTESWGITHSVFAISAEVCGAAFQVSPISVKDGALCMGCSWQDCVVDAKLAEAIVAGLELWLRFLGKS